MYLTRVLRQRPHVGAGKIACLFVCLALLSPIVSWGQSTPWTPVEEVPFPEGFAPPSSYAAYILDLDALRESLLDAPDEGPGPIPDAVVLLFPYYMVRDDATVGDAMLAQIAVARSPVVEPAIADAFPELQTYSFESLPYREITGKFAVGPGGVYASEQTPDGLVRVEPVQTEQGVFYLSYFDRDGADVPFTDFHEDQDETPPAALKEELGPARVAASLAPSLKSIEIGSMMQVYRIAMTTTGEYYQAVDTGNGDLDVVFALIIELINLNALFEPELGVRFVLAGGTLQLLYSQPETPFASVDDPSTEDVDEGDPCYLRGLNAANTQSVLQDDDYDVGFLMATMSGGGGFGCSGQSGVCDANEKAGIAGLLGLDNTPFVGSAKGLLAHELSHNIGSRHTFSGFRGLCGLPNQFQPADAYEPGSGTTIGSYVGNCEEDNVDVDKANGAVEAGEYFHTRSFQRIAAFTQNGDGATCGSSIATGNLAPSVDAGPDYTIPRSTPFELRPGPVSDADPLTYTWEQYDLATFQRFVDTDPDGMGPIIRSVPPTGSDTRIVPHYQDLLDGITRTGEILPFINRDLTFRLTARDNRMGGGGVAYDSMVVHVQGAPFFINSPNGGESIGAGCTGTVTWDPGGSISANVDLELSSDGGMSFSPLALNTPNDGSEPVTLSCNLNPTTTARAKASGVDNIFFDVSDADFEITKAPPTITGSTQDGEVDENCTFVVPFDVTITDDCSVSTADVQIDFAAVFGNATLSNKIVNLTQVDIRTVHATGSVTVSNLAADHELVRTDVSATDGCGMNRSEYFLASVADNIPPTIDVSLDPDMLWSPNHKLVEIAATVDAQDNCSVASVTLDSIASSEPDNAEDGDGDVPNDIQEADLGTDDTSFLVRSERIGGGPGRIYTVVYSAEDVAGNQASDVATVTVDLNQSN